MLTQWAIRWQIPLQAGEELRYMMGVGAPHPTGNIPEGASESAVQAARRLAAPRAGGILWRNNNGALPDERGVPVRYGLGNDSPKTSRVFKSADLIGIMPTVCGCGHRYGVFWAEETKAPGWTYQGHRPCGCKPGKPQCQPCHERAQKAFLDYVIAAGGIARFVSNGEGV